jgi:hypothetical protein
MTAPLSQVIVLQGGDASPRAREMCMLMDPERGESQARSMCVEREYPRPDGPREVMYCCVN